MPLMGAIQQVQQADVDDFTRQMSVIMDVDVSEMSSEEVVQGVLVILKAPAPSD